MLKKIYSILLNEKYIFYIILGINLIFLFTVKYYPSMDGPSHLYNSNLIYHFIKGDCTSLHNFYLLNSIFIPNWLSHLILSLFISIFPAWLAEKALIIIYITGLSLSFRLLVKKINPDNTIFSILIFPFIYSFLFHLGFYNYSLSFIFIFISIYFWLEKENEESFSKYVLLTLLFAVSYLSNVVGFVFVNVSICFLMLRSFIETYQKDKDIKSLLRTFLLKVLYYTFSLLPVAVLLLLFYKTTTFFPTDQKYHANELIKWLNDIRCLIVYNYSSEEKITESILHVMVSIIAISFYIRIRNKTSGKTTSIIIRDDIYILPALIALFLLFIVPNSSSAGTMSNRFCQLFYMLFIIWIASQPDLGKIKYILAFLIIIFHISLLNIHMSAMRNLNRDALKIEAASKHIREGSIVLPVNLSENWMEPHFSNYLGISKPIIIMENYEASVGWFPLKWNSNNMPAISFGDTIFTLPKLDWKTNYDIKMEIDYVFVYGSTHLLNDPEFTALRKIISSKYQLTYHSGDDFIMLYEIK
jgi:hypothetical protein